MINAIPRRYAAVLTLLAATTLLSATATAADNGADAALATISAERLMQHVRVLSSDAFEGRSPATRGEELTLAYLVREFRRLGLEPAAADGSYLQVVPMTGFRSHAAVTVRLHDGVMPLKVTDDYVGWSSVRAAHFQIRNSPLVFVGYGVQAPEYDWDDFKGVDLRGKTLVMLINDPPVADAQHPGELDDAVFGGKAMTYYGRWTYKFEIAARLGAAAAIIVHETVPAAYPYSVVVNSWSSENFTLRHAGTDPSFPRVAGWMTVERAQELFRRSGQDFAALKASAVRRDFRPVALAATVSFDIRNEWRDIESHNVVAKITGSDAARAREAVVYSAHWDHFGWNPALPGPKAQQVFHGALDNASGTAGLLLLAAAYKSLPAAPPRSLLFIATTAEERGLLGASYYAHHPLLPLRDTVADLNMDGVNPLGRTRDLEIVGSGKSGMDALLTAAAATQGRSTRPDSHPERGSFYRADQLEFARVGVPVLYTGSGLDFIDQPPGYGDGKRSEFIAQRYHQVGDVIQPDWSFAGGVQDLQLLWQVGFGLASGTAFPEWLPGSEFKARREAMRPRR